MEAEKEQNDKKCLKQNTQTQMFKKRERLEWGVGTGVRRANSGWRQTAPPSLDGLEGVMSSRPRPVANAHNNDGVKERLPMPRCLMRFEKIPIENSCNKRFRSLKN